MPDPTLAARLLDLPACHRLAASLGDSPETVIPVHLLRRDLATAWAIGPIDTTPPRAVLIHPRHDPTEPSLFGNDPTALWRIAATVSGWACLNVPQSLAPGLTHLMQSALNSPIRTLDDVYHTLEHPVRNLQQPAVRMLVETDIPLLTAALALNDGSWGFGSAAALLRDGYAAGAIVGDTLVAVAYTGARSSHHADIGVATLPVWRGHGLATAAASLIAHAIQTANQTPVWSCGATNAPSIAIAHALGFVERSRRRYLIPEQPASQSA